MKEKHFFFRSYLAAEGGLFNVEALCWGFLHFLPI